MITSFNDVYAELKEKGICKKLVVAWGVDEHSIEAAYKAVEKGFVTATLVGDAKLIADACAKNGMDVNKFEVIDNPNELKAVAQAVQMVHDGQGDVLMKGLCSTDKFLRAILNKETDRAAGRLGLDRSGHVHELRRAGGGRDPGGRVAHQQAGVFQLPETETGRSAGQPADNRGQGVFRLCVSGAD